MVPQAPLVTRKPSGYAGQLGEGSFHASGGGFGGPAVGMAAGQFVNHNPLGKGSRKLGGAFPSVSDTKEHGKKVNLGSLRIVSPSWLCIGLLDDLQAFLIPDQRFITQKKDDDFCITGYKLDVLMGLCEEFGLAKQINIRTTDSTAVVQSNFIEAFPEMQLAQFLFM